MKITAGIVVVALTGMVAGCNNGAPASLLRLPTQPSAALPTPGPALTGLVTDSALRPLAGAKVEVIEGALAGTSAVTDATGWFQLNGPFEAGTRVRAAIPGHVFSEVTVLSNCPLCPLMFRLAIDHPSIDVTGQYTLTLSADPACTELPRELASRSYSATVIRSAPPDWPAGTSFSVRVSDSAVLNDFSQFAIHTAGDYVTFFFEDRDGPALIEQVSATEYLAFSGVGGATAESSGVSTISASFNGYIHQCSQPSLPFSWHDCGEAPGHRGCHSRNNRLTFTRR
jgi:hypothetical protein